jgi:hypothetical protein
MPETYADRPLITQFTVKRDFVHSEIGASADLRMDKVTLRFAHFSIKLRSQVFREASVSW